jgi:deazaflavin-dependent oxidoreductase (nitroreductase family)
MAYLRPGAFQRVFFNKVAMLTGIGNSETLTVTGRKSGKAQSVPVVVPEYQGKRYLVCPRGEAHWVRNLRAAGGRAQLKRRGKTEEITTTEIPVEERAPIIAAYRKKAGRAVAGYWKQLPADKDHPTFRIDSATPA